MINILISKRLFASDNGRIVCCHCAGVSVRTTSKDISGQFVRALPTTSKLSCECGKNGK